MAEDTNWLGLLLALITEPRAYLISDHSTDCFWRFSGWCVCVFFFLVLFLGVFLFLRDDNQHVWAVWTERMLPDPAAMNELAGCLPWCQVSEIKAWCGRLFSLFTVTHWAQWSWHGFNRISSLIFFFLWFSLLPSSIFSVSHMVMSALSEIDVGFLVKLTLIVVHFELKPILSGYCRSVGSVICFLIISYCWFITLLAISSFLHWIIK